MPERWLDSCYPEIIGDDPEKLGLKMKITPQSAKDLEDREKAQTG